VVLVVLIKGSLCKQINPVPITQSINPLSGETGVKTANEPRHGKSIWHDRGKDFHLIKPVTFTASSIIWCPWEVNELEIP
jgi:hypothetical protein